MQTTPTVTSPSMRAKCIVEMRSDGLITREECATRISSVDQELQSARAAAAQVPAPAMDVKALACGLAVAFAAFAALPYDQKLGLLRRAVRDIVLDGARIPSLTLRGGFLGEILASDTMGVNSTTHCSVRCKIDEPPDLVIQFPAPVVIPIIDGRRRKIA
jgi:hypothetical protein